MMSLPLWQMNVAVCVSRLCMICMQGVCVQGRNRELPELECPQICSMPSSTKDPQLRTWLGLSRAAWSMFPRGLQLSYAGQLETAGRDLSSYARRLHAPRGNKNLGTYERADTAKERVGRCPNASSATLHILLRIHHHHIP